jgi:hypothetical protein
LPRVRLPTAQVTAVQYWSQAVKVTAVAMLYLLLAKAHRLTAGASLLQVARVMPQAVVPWTLPRQALLLVQAVLFTLKLGPFPALLARVVRWS